MIAPLTSATLRVVPAAQHGIASAAVVVARMIGMLIGIAALSAWGLYKFNQYLQERLAALPPVTGDTPGARLIASGARLTEASIDAYVLQYGEIFKITWIVCIVGALLALLISGRHEHADEPAEPDDSGPQRMRVGSPADDKPTQQHIRTERGRDEPGFSSRRAAATDPLSRGQQRSSPRPITVGSGSGSRSSADRPRIASQINALMFRGSTGRLLSQSCNAVMLVVLRSCSPRATRR